MNVSLVAPEHSLHKGPQGGSGAKELLTDLQKGDEARKTVPHTAISLKFFF